MTDLLQAGFRLGRPAPDAAAVTSRMTEPTQDPDASPVPAEMALLRAENAELRRRAEIAEAVAAERGRHLDDLRMALRALPAGAEQPRLSWRQQRRLAKVAKAAKPGAADSESSRR